MKKHPTLKILFLITSLVILGVSVFTIINPIATRDIIYQIIYKPDAETSAVLDDLELTDSGRFIFFASRPELKAHDDFIISCDQSESSTYVLGCYSDGVVYVYNLDKKNFPGLTQSTTAHELLHAIWERLPSDEKDKITPLLDEVYNKNRALFSILDIYPSEDRKSELYARVGTEIANLPYELEEHFSKYFKNQDKIVAYYDSYSAPILQLEKELAELKVKLDALRIEIADSTSEYDDRSSKYESAVNEFNNCANTMDCFTEEAFRSRRAELVNEKNSIDDLHQTLLNKTGEYNSLAQQYQIILSNRQAIDKLIESGGTNN